MWNWLQHLPTTVLNLDPVWLVVACALLVFLEDAIFVGFVVPGETAAVIAGVATAIHGVPLWVAIVTVLAAAVVGDTVGYEVGKHALSRVLETKPCSGIGAARNGRATSCAAGAALPSSSAGSRRSSGR